MVPHAQLHPSVPAGAHHSRGVLQRRGHRFFDQYVLPGSCRSERLRGMQSIGRGDEHGLHARITQQCLHITVRRCGTMFLGKGFRATLVPAVDGHQLRLWSGVERRRNLEIGVHSGGDDAPAQCHAAPPSGTNVWLTWRKASQAWW